MAISDNMRGAGLMSASMVAFTLNDTCMKILLTHVPLFQAVFLRGIGTVALLVLVAQRLGQLNARLDPRDRRLVALRSLAEIAAAFFFLTALSHMPIANATSILQAVPLSVTLAAALVLGERVGWRRITAILVGFVGVLLIIKPGPGFDSYALYALASVGCITIRDLAARRISKSVPSILVAFAAALGVMLAAGAASLTEGWVALSRHDLGLLLGAMVCVLAGYILSVAAMRVGDVGTVSPFRYVAVVAAMLVSVVVFAQWPDRYTILGAAIVVGAGVFTLLRNRRMTAQPTGLRPR